MPHASQMSLTLILEKGILHIRSFITPASAFLVILESAKVCIPPENLLVTV